MSPVELLAHEADCTRLCIDFANAIDARDYSKFLDLFTDDGTLDRGGEVFRGRGEIQRFLEARPARSVTRHLCSNIRIAFRSDHEAAGVCYALFFQATAVAEIESPLAAAPPAVVEYHDAYLRTSAGWRIRERKIKVVFKP